MSKNSAKSSDIRNANYTFVDSFENQKFFG